MPSPGADRAIAPAPPTPSAIRSGCGGPKINPATGLSTDYLNHFTEAVMLLEMVGSLPQCLGDLDAWQPKTYPEHFKASRFSNREAIVAAYQVTDSAARATLDRITALLNAQVMRTRELVRWHAGTPEVEAVACRAAARLRPLISLAASVINGTAVESSDWQGPQAAIDAMFRR
jgi:hypothetical protein